MGIEAEPHLEHRTTDVRVYQIHFIYEGERVFDTLAILTEAEVVRVRKWIVDNHFSSDVRIEAQDLLDFAALGLALAKTTGEL